MDKTFYVISHTHWDREWYMPFEKFRMRLCDLINNLFKILEEYPEYIFHLDAQTVVLEDYVSIYPENKDKLERYIKSGNIIVGPWYVQNDFYLSSGEATVRNILIGSEIAENYGRCASVGYTPDQFGLCGQLPQIFNGFGIEKHLFARGYAFYNSGDDMNKVPHDCEFYWEAPDGSRVFSVFMPFWYNNAQRFTPDIDKAIKRINESEEKFGEWTESPYLLMMNGVDHLEAQDDLLPILDKINERLSGKKVVQTTMAEALSEIENQTDAKVVKGELRYGKELDILTGTFSTRVDVKKMNFDTQNMLEHQIEPLYAMLLMAGAKIYPKNEIKHMWKTLIPNHAHDSICCCSNPNVMKHMTDRYLSIREIGEELIERGARFINHHIAREVTGDGLYYLTVINTTQQNYTGVMELTLDINIKDADKDFKIFTPENNEVPYTIISKERMLHATFSPLNLPGGVDVMNYKIRMLAENIPSFGYVNYTVKTGYERKELPPCNILENEYLKVDFDDNNINLLDKSNGICYRDILSFEDIGDNGDSYMFIPFEGDIPIRAELTDIRTEYADSLKSAVRLSYTVNVSYGKDEKGRSGEIVQNEIEVLLSLGKGEKALDIDVKIENRSKYHLLRAVINTGIKSSISYSSSVYDIVKRDSKDVDTEFRNYTQPVNGFVYKKDKDKGVAVFTKGLYEYDNEVDEEIRLSLLRSVDLISVGDNDVRAWGVDDNLMLGTSNVTFAIMPFDGNDESIHTYEQNINSHPIYWFDSTDNRMFTGGRPAVQDTDVDELYYPKDEYEKLNLPHTESFVKVNGSVCVTALKRAEKEEKVVLRAYNPSDEKADNVILSNQSFVKTDLREEKIMQFDNTVSGKEIATLILKR